MYTCVWSCILCVILLLSLSLPPPPPPPPPPPQKKDPHGELTGQNVLIVRGSLEKTAEEFKMEVSQTKELLARCREALYTVRQKRPKPHRDDKILTAWNGQQFV